MRLPQHNGEIDEAEAEKMIDYCMEHGVNYFDTAYMYHGGKSESFVGRALKKYPRGSYMLATKMPMVSVNCREDLDRFFSEQLEKTGADFFDLYLLHALERHRIEKIAKLDVYEFAMKKKAEGKIKFLGFSFHDEPEILEQLVDKYQFDFAQIQLNYLDWDTLRGKKAYEILTSRNIPIVVMEPLRGGYLASLPGDAASELEAAGIASAPAAALRWLGSLENIKVVLSGMSNMRQLVENIQTMENFSPLNEAEAAAVNRAAEILKGSAAIPCTGCNYCEDCPQGIKISKVFELYNRSATFKEGFWNRHYYFSFLSEQERGKTCLHCGLCESHCPQHINIPERLIEVREAFEKMRK
ncbi:MAG TPA: Fe-S oxidoreductase [Ruminococcaceae bacterium]|nr:Fe-S oxidoreductase [Oscillospiraceae bacterium]